VTTFPVLQNLPQTSGGEPNGAPDAVIQHGRQREQQIHDSLLAFFGLKYFDSFA
jgi:hypothetical protein